MVRARVSDPAGPPWWRALLQLGGFGLAAIALGFGLGPGATVALLAVAWSLVARDLLPALPARDAELRPCPGGLRVARAGPLGQRIGARDLRAASTAPCGEGASLALVREGAGPRPVVVELSSAADAAWARRALGLGQTGHGVVGWGALPDRSARAARLMRTLAALGWLAIACAQALGRIELALGLALFVGPLTLLAVGGSLAAGPAPRALSLDAEGVRPGAGPVVPWVAIHGARVEGADVVLSTADGPSRAPLPGATAAEREQAAAHVQAAADRARDPAPASSVSEGALAPLQPTESEDSRTWLERLDTLAAVFGEQGGYRGSGLDAADLWHALESPDAPPRLRAAAARVLARVAPAEAPRRIGDALAVERDPFTRARIQVALEEDVELAARELDRLDAG